MSWWCKVHITSDRISNQLKNHIRLPYIFTEVNFSENWAKYSFHFST